MLASKKQPKNCRSTFCQTIPNLLSKTPAAELLFKDVMSRLAKPANAKQTTKCALLCLFCSVSFPSKKVAQCISDSGSPLDLVRILLAEVYTFSWGHVLKLSIPDTRTITGLVKEIHEVSSILHYPGQHASHRLDQAMNTCVVFLGVKI